MSHTTAGVWDDPKARPPSNYGKFIDVGDTYKGVIADIQLKTFDEGTDDEKTVPVLKLEDGPAVTWVTCSCTNLHREVYRLRPNVGDRITITYTGDDADDYGRRKFDVRVVAASELANDVPRDEDEPAGEDVPPDPTWDDPPPTENPYANVASGGWYTDTGKPTV